MKIFIALCWRVRGFSFLLVCLVAWSQVYAQVIANGGFQTNRTCSINNSSAPFSSGCTPNWYPSHGAAQIAYGGTGGTSLLTRANTQGYTDGVFTSLSLTAGQSYQLTYWAAGGATANTDTSPSQIVLALTEGLSPNANNNVPSPASYTQLTQQSLSPNTGWAQFTVSFTTPTWFNPQSPPQLWVRSIAPSNPQRARYYETYVDSIKIETACAAPNIYYQNTSYLPPQTRTRGQILAGSSVTSGTTGPVTLQYPNYAEFISVGQISLLPGFSVDGPRNDGATIFSAVVVPCAAPQTPCDCLSMDYSRTSAALAATPAADVRTASSDLFPNPSTGKFELRPGKIGLENTGYFTVYDIAGREVRAIDCRNAVWHGESVTLDVSSLEVGLYQYRFVSGTYSTSGRFAIQK